MFLQVNLKIIFYKTPFFFFLQPPPLEGKIKYKLIREGAPIETKGLVKFHFKVCEFICIHSLTQKSAEKNFVNSKRRTNYVTFRI